MRKFTLMKSLLVATCLMMGSANAAWARIDMTTMTGLLGLADNSTQAWTYYSKTVTIKAGETYTYTFTNHTKGSSAEHEYDTWITEVRENTTGYCLDARGDGGGWTWDNSTADLHYSYSGKAWNDNSRPLSDFMSAYNGVIVTLTISSSNDGQTVTIARSATLNDGTTDYSGTWTCSGFAGNDKTINLIAEASHLVINKVVYTGSEDNGAIYTTPDHTAGAQWGSNTGASTVDAEKEHYNNDASSSWAGCAYAKFSFADLPDGVSITSASVTYSVNQGGSYGRDDIIYYMEKDFDLDWGTFAGQTGIDLRNESDRAGEAVGAAATGGTGDRINLNQSVLSAVSAIYEAGQKYILFQWTHNAGGADLYGKGSAAHVPCLAIEYTKATVYTATFTETNNLIPDVSIYSDSEREVKVTNGALTNGTTYYYTAALEGYHNYNGSFTVSNADPSVEFEMTAKTVYNYSVNAVDSENGIIQANILSGTCYADESTWYYLPECVLVDGKLYFRTAEDSYKSETVTSNNQVFSYAYTTATVENVVYFVEGESISGAATSTATNNQRLASKGYMGRGSNLTVHPLPAGSYTVYVRYINTNSSDHAVVVKAGEEDVINNTSLRGRSTIYGSVTLTGETTLSLTAVGSGTSGVDYLYIVKTAVTGTIPTSGYGSLASAYDLDFANATGLTAAYVVTKTTNEAVTLTSVDELSANQGVILKGTGGAAYSIPVKADAADPATNLLSAAVTATDIEANTAYILKDGTFRLVTAASTVPAGKAYLLKSNVPANVRALGFIFDDGEQTGISDVNSSLQSGDFYNLQGQRVGSPKKGLYIVNGTKVIIK